MRFENIFNFMNILFSSLKRLLSNGNVIADFNDIEYRLKICRLCEYKRGDTLKNMKCEICECRIRYKVRLSSSDCPAGKWTALDS